MLFMDWRDEHTSGEMREANKCAHPPSRSLIRLFKKYAPLYLPLGLPGGVICFQVRSMVALLSGCCCVSQCASASSLSEVCPQYHWVSANLAIYRLRVLETVRLRKGGFVDEVPPTGLNFEGRTRKVCTVVCEVKKPMRDCFYALNNHNTTRNRNKRQGASEKRRVAKLAWLTFSFSWLPMCRKLPTFLYVMPFSKTRIFLEETSLVARPAIQFDELKERLKVRMAHLGIMVRALGVKILDALIGLYHLVKALHATSPRQPTLLE